MKNEPYYEYLYWHLLNIVRDYNRQKEQGIDDVELYNTIQQVAREHNADSKLTHENRGEMYYQRVEIIHRNERKPLKVLREWSVI